jgi:hypothetical protein
VNTIEIVVYYDLYGEHPLHRSEREKERVREKDRKREREGEFFLEE